MEGRIASPPASRSSTSTSDPGGEERSSMKPSATLGAGSNDCQIFGDLHKHQVDDSRG